MDGLFHIDHQKTGVNSDDNPTSLSQPIVGQWQMCYLEQAYAPSRQFCCLLYHAPEL